ncbi:uncharacterized protein ALTATR162_LOCUS9910 [Alternaria atra]|uniref:Glucose-methanol-choline oxidoreductase N-terminal domain-containing protein n=1 Tax=Alternaria atra TaxID=119953 RepID=A0A8J2I856_9PLEO|nr:uncharacterized protein ALTATR162_LOCUS9910 [Alternaria atra]CAG5181937.1 unnamed protein product [Alternaria atra]
MAPFKGTRDVVQGIRHNSYDTIIVGGGLAGLVLANRLSEDENKRVLVLEAGANHMGDPRIDTPGLMATLWEDPEYDWGFWCEPQKHLNGRQIQQPRGKLLGGSSAVNYTAILYPSSRNFDAWESLGNQSWSWAKIKPYFRKYHTFEAGSKSTSDLLGLDKYMDPTTQGTDGPLSLTHTDTYGPFNAAWNQVFDRFGMNDSLDPIDGVKLGAFTPPNCIKQDEKTRSYSASAYYNPSVQARANLDVVTEVLVSKLLLESHDSAVITKGVQVQCRDGSLHEVYGKEVILSAGSFQSPQILELSGIGSSKVLEKHGITPVVNNPAVGENLQDHAFAALSFEVADGQISGDVFRDPNVIEALLKQYTETRTGPFTGMPMSVANLPMVGPDGAMTEEATRKLASSFLDDTLPTLSPSQKAQYEQLRSLVLDPKQSSSQSGILGSQMHFNPGKTSMSQAMAKLKPGNYISFTAGLQHPFSRGSVHIRSGNPQDAPIIDPNYLAHPLDVEIMARCIQFVATIATQSPMSELLKPESHLPEGVDFTSLEDARRIARERLYTTFHPTSTCAMLPSELGGVVDDHCRVYGVENLRVVDASIFPMITQGNIQATVYAVAERAADLIKGDWEASKEGCP